jgi:hypothetical protein
LFGQFRSPLQFYTSFSHSSLGIVGFGISNFGIMVSKSNHLQWWKSPQGILFIHSFSNIFSNRQKLIGERKCPKGDENFNSKKGWNENIGICLWKFINAFRNLSKFANKMKWNNIFHKFSIFTKFLLRNFQIGFPFCHTFAPLHSGNFHFGNFISSIW